MFYAKYLDRSRKSGSLINQESNSILNKPIAKQRQRYQSVDVDSSAPRMNDILKDKSDELFNID